MEYSGRKPGYLLLGLVGLEVRRHCIIYEARGRGEEGAGKSEGLN
jgi:hypothetical protein